MPQGMPKMRPLLNSAANTDETCLVNKLWSTPMDSSDPKDEVVCAESDKRQLAGEAELSRLEGEVLKGDLVMVTANATVGISSCAPRSAKA